VYINIESKTMKKKLPDRVITKIFRRQAITPILISNMHKNVRISLMDNCDGIMGLKSEWPVY
jgi:hypothetical protein